MKFIKCAFANRAAWWPPCPSKIPNTAYSIFCSRRKSTNEKFFFKTGLRYENLLYILIKFAGATSSMYFLPPRSASAETFKFQQEDPVVVQGGHYIMTPKPIFLTIIYNFEFERDE